MPGPVLKGIKPLHKTDKHPGLKNVAEFSNNTLKIGDMNLAVLLPQGEELDEWLAVNVIEFYNEISLLYGCLTEFCTKESCPKMCAGSKFEYRWAEGNQKVPVQVSAPEYIDYLMNWIEKEFSNEELFPCKQGVPFPPNFVDAVKVIFRRLFRVYAHIYHSHFKHISALDAAAHLNTSFKHFIYFVSEYKLIENADFAPLAELVEEFNKKKKLRAEDSKQQ